MCLIRVLARCVIRVTVFPFIRLTRSKVLNLNRSNRVLLHGQVQRIMHAVVCRIQHTLERVVIRAGLIQQLTTPQQRVGSTYYQIRLHLFCLELIYREIQLIHLIRTRSFIRRIFVHELANGIALNHLAAPQQCLTQDHGYVLRRVHGRLFQTQVQLVVRTIATRAQQALYRIFVRSRLIQLLATPKQRVTLANRLILNGMNDRLHHLQIQPVVGLCHGRKLFVPSGILVLAGCPQLHTIPQQCVTFADSKRTVLRCRQIQHTEMHRVRQTIGVRSCLAQQLATPDQTVTLIHRLLLHIGTHGTRQHTRHHTQQRRTAQHTTYNLSCF